MLNIYSCFRCKTCKKEFILLTEEIEQMSKDRYITCPYCNSKKILKEKVTSNLKECMDHRSYKRIKGAIRQK